MFTGIIEDIAQIKKIEYNGTNTSYWLETAKQLLFKVDQSVSHNGICLTVEQVIDNQYKVTAIAETITKTDIANWNENSYVNIEQCLPASGRFDGHFVSGHVDGTAICREIVDKNGSWEYSFEIPKQYAANIIEKGSIAINGISLTIFNVTLQTFNVAIIPYTYENTIIKYVNVNDKVNIEYDIIGKYLLRKQEIAAVS